MSCIVCSIDKFRTAASFRTFGSRSPTPNERAAGPSSRKARKGGTNGTPSTAHVQAAGPIDSLIERLTGVTEAVTTAPVDVWWDTGIGVQSQTITEIGIILGLAWVPMALDEIEGWHRGEAADDTIVLSIAPIFSRRVGRDD